MEPVPPTSAPAPAEPVVRVAIVAPAFNHAAALSAVLDSLAATRLPTIVVNDGSTDETAAIVASWSGEGRWVVTHPINAGKGGALRSGFEEARRRGFTHAATIDTDGQHDPSDLARLLELLDAHPDSLIIGARSGGDRAPGKSEIGRRISNALVRLESGVIVDDSQSGMRLYPLNLVGDLTVRAGRYGFETEVIVRAGWRGIPIVETPIRCIYDVPGGRTTHFRVGQDSLSAAAMHARLLLRGLWPDRARLPARGANAHTGSIPRRLLRWLSPVRLWDMLRGAGPERERAAASFGVGVLMAVLPLYGVKTVLCLWLSDRLRLHPLAVIGAS
ncbi:MAG: glycosyltransferase family 2 protein, partial [Phycisphaerales bacterium]